jgi:hypothetical protein
MVVSDPAQRDAIFRMQRRYVKQWNEIELDRSRSLSEHTHEVFGAQVVGANRRFILHAQVESAHWILEVMYARGFSEFHPGWSFGKNPFRSVEDMRSIHLHWSENGRILFEQWLVAERTANESNGEATEYVSRPRSKRRDA